MEGTEVRRCILFRDAPISLPKIYLFVNIFRASDLDCQEATTPFLASMLLKSSGVSILDM